MSTSKRTLRDQVAIVTGGSQGIGQAIADRFLTEGMSVVVADHDVKAGRALEADWKGRDVLFIPTDVSRETDVRRCVHQTIHRHGRIDVLINNAGISDPVSKLDIPRWQQIIAVNLTGSFLFAHYAIPHLQKSKGSIVNIASTRAWMSEPDTPAYSASKGGLVALTHSLAITLGPDVRVNCISPGWIDTKNSKLRPIDHAQHPVGRVGKPADIASLALFLISSESGFITGQNYVSDGGMTKKMIYAD